MVEVDPIVLVYAVRYALPQPYATTIAAVVQPLLAQVHRLPQDVLATLRRDILAALPTAAPRWAEVYVALGGSSEDVTRAKCFVGNDLQLPSAPQVNPCLPPP